MAIGDRHLRRVVGTTPYEFTQRELITGVMGGTPQAIYLERDQTHPNPTPSTFDNRYRLVTRENVEKRSIFVLADDRCSIVNIASASEVVYVSTVEVSNQYELIHVQAGTSSTKRPYTAPSSGRMLRGLIFGDRNTSDAVFQVGNDEAIIFHRDEQDPLVVYHHLPGGMVVSSSRDDGTDREGQNFLMTVIRL